jgi:hypothetical protein
MFASDAKSAVGDEWFRNRFRPSLGAFGGKIQHQMSETFSAKLDLVLKALSISRGRLAADLGVDKSVVGRWVTGAVKPSSHNLSSLTALIAGRVAGFKTLDWDRSFADLANQMGADPSALPGLESHGPPGLPLAIAEHILATTQLRGAAYEGFFRSTRPYVLQPGRFVHDHAMVRLDPTGYLRLRMGTGGTVVEGWLLTLHNQLFTIAADVTSGALLFGIFYGVATPRADVIDGVMLGPALDVARTPTACGIVFERVGDLTDDPEADDQRFEELTALNPVAPDGSISEAMRRHLLRDIGPEQHALGGDMLLRLPLSRSLSRGPGYREQDGPSD